MAVLIKVEVVAADHDAAKAAIERIQMSVQSTRDAGLHRAELHDLGRNSIDPAAAPYEVIQFEPPE